MTGPFTGSAAPRAAAILVIDDEQQIRRAVGSALAPLCDRVLEAATGTEALALAAAESPDLIVLDLGLPDMPGIEVSREIRRWSTAPIVVLSARHGEREKVDLLTAGADDYVTKPFSLAELVARAQVQLRRAAQHHEPRASTMLVDGLTIDIPRREARRDGVAIRLTKTEWQLLQTFAQHPGRTLTHQQIFDAVWAKAFGNPQQYLRVHLTNLRRKIERHPAEPRIIITDPGVGYRLEAGDD